MANKLLTVEQVVAEISRIAAEYNEPIGIDCEFLSRELAEQIASMDGLAPGQLVPALWAALNSEAQRYTEATNLLWTIFGDGGTQMEEGISSTILKRLGSAVSSAIKAMDRLENAIGSVPGEIQLDVRKLVAKAHTVCDEIPDHLAFLFTDYPLPRKSKGAKKKSPKASASP